MLMFFQIAASFTAITQPFCCDPENKIVPPIFMSMLGFMLACLHALVCVDISYNNQCTSKSLCEILRAWLVVYC